MEIEYGQIWRRKGDNPDDPVIEVLVTGTQDFAWYVPIRNRYGRAENEKWSKAHKDMFERKFEYTGAQIKKGNLWKTRSNSQIIVISDVRDNGFDTVIIYHNLTRVDVGTFYYYYAPCTEEETNQHKTQMLASVIEKLVQQGDNDDKNRLDRVIED